MFHDYYAKFLSTEVGLLINNCIVCKTDNRDIPLNKKFIYKIIITDFNGNRYVSVSPAISDNVIHSIITDIKDRNFDDILNSQHLHITGLRINKMYRMILDNRIYSCNNISTNYKKEYIEEFKKYIIRYNEDIVSYCKISNIDCGYGNIVVWTDENHRNKGLAKQLLFMLVSKCKSEGIKPLYLVNSQNIASIRLAKSVGFKIVQTEIVACDEIT